MEALAQLRILSGAAVCFALAYAAATVAGAPRSVLDTVFTMTIPLVVPAGWWAFVRAPEELRTCLCLLAGAATLWLIGSLGWYVYFVRAGNTVPAPAGPWEIAFATAYALAAGGLYVA